MNTARVPLGQTGIQITPIVFGGNVFGWTLNEQSSFTLLDSFVEKGGNMIDTADQYSIWVPGNKGGESETIIGNWMHERGNRADMIIATKVGGVTLANDKPNTSSKHIIASVEASLKRLRTDYIDLYYTHFDDPHTPVAETLQTYQSLIKAGKIRSIGVSNMSVPRIQASLQYAMDNDIPSYQVLQPEYNLYFRQKYEHTLLPIVSEHNLGVLTYFSLASGFLTGKYKSLADCEKTARGHSIKAMMNDRGLQIIASLEQVAEKYQTTPSTIALAWLLAQNSVTAPIVSATSHAQLANLFQSLHITLDEQSVDLLNKASAY